MKTFVWLSRAFLMLACVVSVIGCSSSRYVPDGHYRLERVVINSDSKDLDLAALEPYIRQKSNSKWFSLFKIPLGAYALSGRDSTKWINRTLKNIGEAPVIYDSAEARLSAEDLRLAMQNQGYMRATVDLQTRVKGNKLTAIYTLRPGRAYVINSVSYNIEDEGARGVIDNYNRNAANLKRSANRANAQSSNIGRRRLQAGEQFNVSRLDNERKRITNILLDSGFYKFSKDYIVFTADSAANDTGVNLTLNLLKYRAGSDGPSVPHPRYKIRNINYHNASSAQRFDNGGLHLRRRVLDNSTALREGRYFDNTALQDTYRKFGRLSAVRYTNILFTELPDTAYSYAQEPLLDCDIQLDTSRPSTISFQPEGTNTAGDLGAAASLTYQNRNLFHGSELLSIQLRGAFEAITGLEGYRDEDFEEYNVEGKLQFPMFIAPFLSKAFRRRSPATSELSLSWNLQNRPEFHRRVFSAAWRYSWTTSDRAFTFKLDIPGLNYVSMPWISETFKHDYLDSVSNRNAILRYNYEDLFISRLGFSMTYSSAADAMRLSIESSGNLLDALSKPLRFSSNANGQHTLFGIAYAQYAKLDFDYTRLIPFDEHNTLALHGDFGVAYPYGNSRVLPFEKRYFSGGANSVRGWSVRGLGPGKYRGRDGRIDFINQTGDVKLDLNAEYRTFLFWKFNGAIFVDAGNIWTLRNYPDQPGGQFQLTEFYKQIAVAYGLGLRLNFGYFILRFDMGMKAINPAYTNASEHYAIAHPDFNRDFTFHFAVGMPF